MKSATKATRWMLPLMVAVAIVGTYAGAFATWDKHTHTSDGTIMTVPTITQTGTHILQASAPIDTEMSAWVALDGGGTILQFHRPDGGCYRTSGTLSSEESYEFYSRFRNIPMGVTVYARLAHQGHVKLPTCTPN